MHGDSAKSTGNDRKFVPKRGIDLRISISFFKRGGTGGAPEARELLELRKVELHNEVLYLFRVRAVVSYCVLVVCCIAVTVFVTVVAILIVALLGFSTNLANPLSYCRSPSGLEDRLIESGLTVWADSVG